MMPTQHEPQPNPGVVGSLYLSIYWSILAAWLCIPKLAYAYIGVTLSTGALIIIALLIFSIALALYVLVWFPIRRRMKRRASGFESSSSIDTHTSPDTHGDEE